MKSIFLPIAWGLVLCGAGVPMAQVVTEPAVRWNSFTHPLSYQGRSLTRSLSGDYFMVVRTGTDINVWKRGAKASEWTNLGAVNQTPLSGREGDCAALATDGKGAIHVVYYDGASPDLAHRVSEDGKTFGSQEIIIKDVAWQEAGPGSPFLHIDIDNGLHVAFSDDSGDSPYHAYQPTGGAWKINKVSDLAFNMLRPSVVTLPGGRVIYGFSTPAFHAFFSDDKGVTWKEASPSATGISSIFNCRLIAHGDEVIVTGQKTNPDPRGVSFNSTDGLTMAWRGWEAVSSGTGADPSAFLSSDGKVYVLYRVYPDPPRSVSLAVRDQGKWTSTTLSEGSDDYIFTYAYWQEFHRGDPTDNTVSFLLPNATSNQIYFGQLTGVQYPKETETVTGLKRRGALPLRPGIEWGEQIFDSKGKLILSGTIPLSQGSYFSAP